MSIDKYDVHTFNLVMKTVICKGNRLQFFFAKPLLPCQAPQRCGGPDKSQQP